MKISIRYFAALKEKAGRSAEDWQTEATTAADLYKELRAHYGFSLDEKLLKLAINREYKAWASELREGDEVVFIPPVSGG